MSIHRCSLIVATIIGIASAQQPNATNPTPVTNPVATNAVPPLRVDSIRRVEAGNMYHHVYARVPLVGTGAANDPKRPMFVPVPGSAAASKDHTGILGYQMQISDDGKWALVEFVGATPKDLEVITKSTDPNVKAFERGKSTLDDVQAEFVKYKANFSFSALPARVQ